MTRLKKPDANFFRQMLSGHSVLGLTAAFLMYVICVSGTLAVFYKEFWRWEQPTATIETMEVSGQRIEQAVQHAIADLGHAPDFIGLDMPTSDWPRMSISYGEQRRYVAADGSLEADVDRPWTSFLARLHFALNLPLELGVVIVGIFGVLLTALIVSGFLAHPGILRDAFSLRLSRSRQLQQTDLHNRLSVWAAPFHLIIAVTGAILGLAGAISLAASLLQAPETGDPAPAAEQTAVSTALPDFDAIWQSFSERSPLDQVFYLSVYEPATDGQEVELSAIQPDRLYWSQSHRYDADGNYLRAVGGAAASVGGQMQASLYRLHFGHFGGMPVKIIFLLLGTALCIVTATGVNIWLAKRRQRKLPADTIDRLWQFSVWGTLLLISLSAVMHLALGIAPIPVFWGGLLILAAIAWRRGTPLAWAYHLRQWAWLVTAAVPVVHTLRFGSAAWQGGSLSVNLVWLALAAGLFIFQQTTTVRSAAPPTQSAPASEAGS
ncbi:MAG: PepSY-associated TM helix domain-containing protein [Pseudohongiella sp.]|uniref:PepSY-associated TM helix domain-containing protein n=1 Tax=Pseudohongiella sp. TaxID=1979412 RepID=UPI0034A0A2ED